MKGDEAGHARASPDPRRRREGPRDARCASVLGEGTARGAQGRVGRGRRPALRGGEKALKGRRVEKAELRKGSPRRAHGRTGGPADRRLTPRGPQGPLGALAGAGARRWQPGAGMEGSVGT